MNCVPPITMTRIRSDHKRLLRLSRTDAMRTFVALAVCLAAATAIAGTSLQFGQPMPVADLRSGDPATFDRIYAVWQDGSSDVAAVVQRASGTHTSFARMTIGADGHADPSTLVTLPIAEPLSLFAPMGDSLMVVSWNHDKTSTATHLDRNGALLATPKTVDSIQGGLTCNAQRCLVWQADHGVIIDGNGQSRARVDHIIVNAVASDSGFLIWDNAKFVVLDNDGKALVSIPATLATASLSFDGQRYVVAGLPQVGGPFVRLWTIDPISGVTIPQGTLTMQPSGYLAYNVNYCALTWNGSQYLMLATIAPPIDLQPWPSSYAPFWVAMRLTPSFQPLEMAKPLLDDASVAMTAAPTADGFRLLFPSPLHAFARTALIRSSDGSVIPGVNGQSIVVDRASQFPLAVAASRSAILSVYAEMGDTTQTIYASRVDRSGKHLDPQPIALGSADGFQSAWAASDGDGFLVLWQESPTGDLTGGLLDASRRFKRFPTWMWTTIRPLHIDVLNGAYQVAFFAEDEIGAMTVPSDGTAGDDARFFVYQNTGTATDIRFDGTRIVAVWYDPAAGIYALTKDGREPESIRVIAPAPDYVGDLAIAPHGDGYVAAITTVSESNTSLFLNRLTHDAQFVLPGYGVLAAKNVTPIRHSLLRIDDTWFATTALQRQSQYLREVTPFNPTTLQAGPLSILTDSVYRELVSGWNGEGLAWSGPDVPVPSGWVRKMDVQVVHTARPRAAAK